jgi:hypothetical protein
MDISRTLKKIQTFFWWPKMREGVYKYVNICNVCQRSKAFTMQLGGLLQHQVVGHGLEHNSWEHETNLIVEILREYWNFLVCLHALLSHHGVRRESLHNILP